MRAVLDIVFLVLNLYEYVIIGTAVMSWLIAFNVVNVRNDLVRSAWNTMNALTEPFLQRIRRFMPNTSGLDLSPIVLYLLIELLKQILWRYVYPYVF